MDKKLVAILIALIAATVTALTGALDGLRGLLAAPEQPVAGRASAGSQASAGRTGAAGTVAGRPAAGTVAEPPKPQTGFSVGTNFWYLAEWGDYPWTENPDFTGNPWNPAFVEEAKKYSVLRFMDYGGTNHSNIVSWNQRMQKSDPRNREIYVDQSSKMPGLAYEWMADLGNRTGRAIWVCLPHKTEDAYATELAKLLKTELRPEIPVFVEYSNEVWNGAFEQFAYANSEGVRLGLPGSNQWYKGIAYSMWRTLKIGKAFEDVLGKDRVQVVFAESGNLDLGTQALRTVYQSSQWNPHQVKIDLLALAPYVSTGNGASWTLAGWKGVVDSLASGEPIAVGLRDAKAYGIPAVGCYESGQHFLSGADSFSRSENAYQAYDYMLAEFSKRLTGPCLHYAHAGSWSSGGAWGAKERTGGPESPKSRALLDWAKKF